MPEQQTHSLGLILIGGSEGHLYQAEEVAPQFAALGFVVLAVDYHDGYDPGRKLDQIPIEMFTHAASWLRHSSHSVHQVAVLGDSRGSEAALLTGVYGADVAAVLAFVPSSVTWGATDNSDSKHDAAWTWQGKPLPCANCSTGNASWDQILDRMNINDPARIAVERIQAPIFLAGSEADAVWPSARMATDIALRLEQRRFQYPVTLLIFPESSHNLWGTGPKNPIQTYQFQGRSITLNSGGTTAGTEDARNQTWAAMLLFLKQVESR